MVRSDLQRPDSSAISHHRLKCSVTLLLLTCSCKTAADVSKQETTNKNKLEKVSHHRGDTVGGMPRPLNLSPPREVSRQIRSKPGVGVAHDQTLHPTGCPRLHPVHPVHPVHQENTDVATLQTENAGSVYSFLWSLFKDFPQRTSS